jgi:hypothetical protein
MKKCCLLACICLTVMAPERSVYAQTAKNAGAPAAQRAGASQLENRINAATAAFKGQRYDEATRLFQEVVAMDPKHALAWHFLGQSLEKISKQQEARSAYEKSLELQPSGTLADRNRALMAQMRTRPEPQFPPGLSQETRNLILKSPLFTSSPATVAMNCAEVQSSKVSETTTNISYTARLDGLVENTSDAIINYSDGSIEKYLNKRVFILGGLQEVSVESNKANTARPIIITYEILSASGSLFPLKIGNRLQLRTVSRINNDASTSSAEDKTCEVEDVLSTAVAKRIMGTEDALRIRCEINTEQVFMAGRDGATRRDTKFFLCSNTLGLCPVYWWMEAGADVPDFASGFTYTRKDIKFSIRKTCAPTK